MSNHIPTPPELVATMKEIVGDLSPFLNVKLPDLNPPGPSSFDSLFTRGRFADCAADLDAGLFNDIGTNSTAASWKPASHPERILSKLQEFTRGMPLIRIVHEIRVHPKSLPWLLILLRSQCVPGADAGHIVFGGIRIVAAETLLPGVFETYDGMGRFIEAKRWSPDFPWVLLP
jgi:hypothetical protein